MRADAPTGYGSHIRETLSGFERAHINLVRWIGGEVSEIVVKKRVYGEAKRRMPRFAAPMLRGARDLFEIVDDYRNARRLCQVLRTEECAFIYERMVPFRQMGYIAAKRVHIPWILEINDPMEETLRYYPSPLRGYAIRLGRQMATKADGVVVGSRRLKDYLVDRGVAADRVLVVYPTVDYEIFDVTGAKPKNDDIVRIGFVGSMKIWHGGDLLIRAFSSLVHDRHIRDVELEMIGDGPETERWKELAVQLALKEKIRFHGSIDFQQMPKLIQAIDVCAIPNATWYGSPTKLFEYGAMGKAVIGPMDTPVDEVVTHNVNGVLFKKGDVDGLADGLQQLVADRSMRERLGSELQGKLKQEITWSKNIDNIMTLYKCSC